MKNETETPLDRLMPVDRVREYDIAWELRDFLLENMACKDTKGRIIIYGRDMALKLLIHIESWIGEVPGGGVLLLRFDNIRVMPEFTDELAHGLSRRGHLDTQLTKGRILVIANPEEGATVGLHQVLTREKAACMVLDTAQEPWKLTYVGKVQPHLVSLLEYVHDRESVTSPEVADRFHFKLADASRRLQLLYEQGFVRRIPAVLDSGSLGYAYRYFHPARERDLDIPGNRLAYEFYEAVRLAGRQKRR